MTAATGTARTTAGDVPVGSLGRVDYHEHLFQVSPLLPGDELEGEAASTREATLLRGSGFDTMVDATPVGLGRRPAALARAAAAAGLHVVAATGAHRQEHYAPGHWLLEQPVETLTQLFLDDLVVGMPATDHPDAVGRPDRGHVRAGIVKMGIGYWRISAFERRVATAAADVHRATGAPVMVHTEHATAAHEVLDLLDAAGVPASRTALAHVDRNPDPGLHAELCARGAFLGYDGPARARSAPDSVVLACLAAVVAAGHGGSVLLGGDVARASRYVSYGGLPGLGYLGDRFVPRARALLGEGAVEQILVANPARWLSWRRADDGPSAWDGASSASSPGGG